MSQIDEGARFGTAQRWSAVVLTVLGLAVVAETRAEVLWCSNFETEEGQPVTHDQPADVIDNDAGPDGQALGTLTDLPAILYVEYGQPGIDPIPAGLDPAGVAGDFSISTPDDRRTGMRTNLRSDAGGLDAAITMEGYFNTSETEIITDPTFIGRRLMTQKRSADDGQSRLAIGLHGRPGDIGEGMTDYDGFQYSGTAIADQNGGLGWSGGWIDSAGDFGHLSNDGVNLDSPAFPFTPVGSRISGVGGVTARFFSAPVDLGADGNSLYVSTLIRRGDTTADSAADIQFQLQQGSSTVFRFGNTSGDQFFVGLPDIVAGPAIEPDVVYFVVAKVVSASGDTPDQAFLSVFGPDDNVPLTEPATWDIETSAVTNAQLNRLRVNIGSNNTLGEIDEIRIGNTWAGVTDPDAPFVQPDPSTNVLAAYWFSDAAGAQLELGTTPIEPEVWYHFALVWDGTDLRWYLDGNLEGEVLNPDLIGPGPAAITLANNRSSGATDDRGYFGLVDEFRVWERGLPPGELLVNGGSAGSGLLWSASFETEFGEPVVHAQPVERVDTTVGPAGSVAGLARIAYAEYAEDTVEDVPASIDPAGLAEAFALSLPLGIQITAVNSNIPSDAGNLANALTFQGYFNSGDDIPILSPTFVGRRLVTQKRSSNDGQSRLAIGIHADAAEQNNVLAVFRRGADGSNNLERGTTPIQPNVWHHFALVWDGTDLRWYLDGNLEGELLDTSLAAPGSALIGVGNNRTTDTGVRAWQGLIDKIIITDEPLQPGQFLTAGVDGCLGGAACNVPFADADDDTDVDQSDFSVFQLCYTGTDGDVSQLAPICACFDRNGDNDVDGEDFTEFKLCVTGPDVPWSLDLTPGCAP